VKCSIIANIARIIFSQAVNHMEVKERVQRLQKEVGSNPSSPDQRSSPQSAEDTVWWRSPLIGYPACVILVGIAQMITYADRSFTSGAYFPSAPFFLVTVFVALLWGVGPSLLAILLGFIALIVFIIPPQSGLTNFWDTIAVYSPFLLSQLIVAIITAQRESAHRRAIIAGQREHLRSEELAQVNVALSQSNRELEQADQLKDLFFSRAAHELKTPLAAIQGQAQLALRLLNKQTEQASAFTPLRTHLEKIEVQTHRLHALINDLLNLSSLRSGKIPLRVASCDLGTICREVVEDQHTLSGLLINLELPAGGIGVRADCERLTQLLINLVSNAVKYAAEGSAIRVSIEPASAHWQLQVHNSCPSIPQEYLANIFEPFYRTPSALSSKRQGWGLGLTISKEIVEQHRGHIWVESSEGKGTTFFVELPMEHS
jgi:signal transduction histidine kinase